ncbi:hypothetical protein M8C21_015116 [Ambrosia artemisiifolia]|uniref:Uncharacterized protein n=1 Tax=Ambrosia artemisiifolia TaxID=4212 RepID=A0AAD5BYH6_AMBAR|nr:hypothetical protein M8C21_015116 [Ambrosia artemisiifolia]
MMMINPTSLTRPTHLHFSSQLCSLRRNNPLSLLSLSTLPPPFSSVLRSNSSNPLPTILNVTAKDNAAFDNFDVQVTTPRFPSHAFPIRLTLSDQAFFLLTFIACTATASFVGFVTAAVPALYAMSRTAIAVAKLADTAREELPSTMAAIRLSGMEISDLTLELSDLSQEISDGVNKSAQAVQAAEAGVRQIGSLARQKTMSMIEERANLPVISIQPVVAGVAKKTSQVVSHASKRFMNIIHGGESTSLGDERIDI